MKCVRCGKYIAKAAAVLVRAGGSGPVGPKCAALLGLLQSAGSAAPSSGHKPKRVRLFSHIKPTKVDENQMVLEFVR